MNSALDDAHDLDRLDQLDRLISSFRPIENLFMMMAAVDPGLGDGAELVRSCSEIGLNLTAQFRQELKHVFGREGGGESQG